MRWRKIGLVYRPSGSRWWAKSHAYLPTAEVICEEVIRVHFASLDEDLYGRIGYVDLDVRNPKRILDETEEPILDIGEPGTFDDSGVSPSCVITLGNKKHLYYIGWRRCEQVPYMIFAGLALSGEDGRFARVSSTPILDRTPQEPFLRSAVSILAENGLFRAWYVSGIGWTKILGRELPVYVIRYADSQDGIRWRSYDHVCIQFKNDDEFGFGRPWVIRDGQLYRMWYAIRARSSPYTLGYAESHDGLHWFRFDQEVGIWRSESGWDSEMMCFPCVVDAGGERYMF